jgi:ArpU family phage transcriptional regulator
MNWQNEAIEDLKKYTQMRESLENIRERISALKYSYTAIKPATMDTTPVMGGASKNEDRLIDNIVERQRLEYTFKATKKIVDLIEKGLNDLDGKEKLVLERFYIYRTSGHVERLMDELNYEHRRIYQIKDEALYKFTIKMYGIIDY